ncbi:hypothetical protein OG455_28230 [Kitasatospora sp. NBC_01287]|uniref:hypothetical protein n=1 Tax=Kitasatospora sp. NBC_01287 TaxID=2903573 RepID=UPI00225A613A|nr:hypothetical protein [Kitasatospora sp. NBC_01287]MCX4749350.1 hypothetical protein [Kitasatospora sp. NBC_01287]
MGERSDGWIRVPVGDDSRSWATRGRCRRVLLVVHNVTAATRLLDVIPLFRDDLRVQLLAGCTGSSPFQSGVADLLASVGVPVLPWEQAVRVPVDLAISASFGGQLGSIEGKLAVLSHGVGYNKRLRTPDTGHRTPDTGHRTPDTGHRTPVFGLAPEWLLADGAPIADAMVLSHPEQLDRLREACPEAVPTAVLGGDPCFDRILAARRYRERYRRALGVRPGQRLVLLNSTWNPTSLFGDGGPADVLPLLLPRLTEELPVDEYRLAAVLHPNIWHGHGAGQIRLWLDRARRAGLTLIDPLDGWRQALIAADLVLGDFGSVSYYAAALGTPVLLGAAPLEALGTDSPVADFVRRAPRLDPFAALLPQLANAVREHLPVPGPAELTSSAPGQSAGLLRELFYRLIGIPEPAGAAVLDPLPLPPHEPAARTAPLRVLTRVIGGADGPLIGLHRYADPRHEPQGHGEGHLAVPEDTLDPGVLALADVILRHGPAHDPRLGHPAEWATEVLEQYPSCTLAAYLTEPGSCTALHRDGTLYRLTADPAGADPAAHASALLAWLGSGRAATPDLELTVRTGAGCDRVRVTAVLPGNADAARRGR